MTLARLNNRQFLRDPFFIIAALLAPPVWLLIYFTPLLPLPARSVSPAQLLVLGLAFPVLEELAFRGLIQGQLLRLPRLAQRHLGFTGANLGTSLLFATAHLFHQSLPVSLLILMPSLVFGELRDRFGSTRPAILMHVYYNLGLLLVLVNKPA
jgi:membrane protease YdiL (CAAX protease family)